LIKKEDVVMFKWKRKHERNKFEYTLVTLAIEEDEDEVVGSVVVIEDIDNGDIKVKAKWEYALVLEDDEDEVVGSVVVIEDIGSGDITVKAECEEIGYKVTQERVEKKFLKITVLNMKKFIKEELEKIEANR
jgi:hypothetical protein